MGWNDIGHLGLGWWGVEHFDPPSRWTQREAHIHLLLPARATAVEAEICTGPAGLGPVSFSLGVAGAEQKQSVVLEPDNWRTVSLPLPRASGRQVEVGLSADETRNPAACGLSAYGRDLGLTGCRVPAASRDNQV